MPRPLSLRKNHQSVLSKNQKPITQFFKNGNREHMVSEKCSQEPPKNDITESESKISNKRKASPAGSKHYHGESCHEENSKKTKVENKKSPQKENDKIELLNKECTPVKQQDVQESKVTRSPLSLIFENDDPSNIISSKNVNHKIQDNPSEGVSSTVEDLYKNNHDVNFTSNHECNEVLKKYTTPRKSPLKGGSKSPKSVTKVLTFDQPTTEKSSKTTPTKTSSYKAISKTPQKLSTFLTTEKSSKKTPLKKSPFPTEKAVNKTPVKTISKTPQKLSTFLTCDKLSEHELSPSKSGATVDILNNEDNADDLFGDDWELNNVEEMDQVEDLDLSIMQRCEILNVKDHGSRKEIRLKNAVNNRGTCFVEGFWMDTPLVPGDIISVIASHDSAGQYCVSNTSGLLVLRPDHLISSTSVVAGVFCKRKAVLQERWRGIDSANAAMTIGIIIHELVQKALTQNITDASQLRIEAQKIIKESIQLLYDAGLTEEEVQNNMQVYIPSLGDFMNTYVTPKSTVAPMQAPKDRWNGKINKVLDIEENLCCPQLGLKGKIDATVDVTVPAKKSVSQEVVPLELKSGKASQSAEHRGQLVLYGMMLSALKGQDPHRATQRGLLLYLKDRVELKEVSCGYPERRDLVMLRNQLVQNLAAGPDDVDPEQLVDIEDASVLLQQKLPEPIERDKICSKCPYLTICSLHLWHTDGPSVSDSHPLSTLREAALGHLTPEHIKYFLHWTTLLKIEEKGQSKASPLHSLWTDSVEKREKRGTCAGYLQLQSVTGSGVKFLHIFKRNVPNGASTKSGRELRGLQEGDFCIVSVDERPWVAAGVIVCADDFEIHMLLERDLSRRLCKTTAFHIDAYESYGSSVQNFTNLGVLLDDTDRSERLRRLIINKDPPLFEAKLPREVGRLGTKLMRSLNIQQQRAVLKALAAKHYALLKGLPGTGKTQTVSVLIQMLVGLKQRVLVTAHTHSAVDNVLARLPESMRVMRLGARTRVSPDLLHRCEEHLASDCDTTLKLEQLYDSMEVVGVTCLGATHAMLSRITFDVCVVDEATQVLQSTVLRPLFAANRFVLVGDPEQLPPVVRSKVARRLGMEESLFHRLMSDEATSTLQLQYRMNQPLADVANKVAYGGQLQCAGDTVAQAKMAIDLKKISHLTSTAWVSSACSPSSEEAAVFLDLAAEKRDDDVTNSCVNKTEACLVLSLVHALMEGGIKSSDIGVVAPYRDQVALLKRSLQNRVEASTVDQFQGRDKSVIIYSCTRSDGQDERKVKEGEVLNDQRRLAVSVTRAKHKLIVIGNSRALSRYAPLQRLIEACVTVVLNTNDIEDFTNKYKDQVV